MAESTTEHFTIVRILHGASDVPEVLNPLKGNHFMEAQQDWRLFACASQYRPEG